MRKGSDKEFKGLGVDGLADKVQQYDRVAGADRVAVAVMDGHDSVFDALGVRQGMQLYGKTGD